MSCFIKINNFYDRKKKEYLYQLSDYYTMFYLRFIKDYHGKDEHFWSNTVDNTSRRAWAGLTFEILCKDHIKQIKHKLGISGVLSEESSWFVKPDEENGITGAQIDLIINRRDMNITFERAKLYCTFKARYVESFELNTYSLYLMDTEKED